MFHLQRNYAIGFTSKIAWKIPTGEWNQFLNQLLNQLLPKVYAEDFCENFPDGFS